MYVELLSRRFRSMHYLIKKLLSSVAVALTVTGLSLPAPARAQTYPIDCAILLCLSGGWPNFFLISSISN